MKLTARVEGNFLETVLEKSFPSAFTIAIGATLITNIGLALNYDPNMLSTVCILFYRMELYNSSFKDI